MSVTGTDDPALLRTIREALADPVGEYDPRLGFVPGPASRYDRQSLAWAACVQNALVARGRATASRATYHLSYHQHATPREAAKL